MFSMILMWMLVAMGVLGLIFVLYCAWRGVPMRDIDDVVHFLYPVDLSLVDSLLDPAADFALRWSLSPRSFRAAQRRRMRIYRELLLRMSHNSMVLVEFGNALCVEDGCNSEFGSELQDAAIKTRLYTGSARLRIRTWLLLPYAFGIIPTPDLARLRKAADLDGPKTYDELRTAAAAAFAQLQPAEIEALTRNL
ncbi:MAG: hypothetical protein WCA49_10315 [Candidatus Sulfotelmatobacter sp.]